MTSECVLHIFHSEGEFFCVLCMSRCTLLVFRLLKCLVHANDQ